MMIMQFLYQAFQYLRNLEWSEKVKECIFCDENNFKDIVYKDKEIIAVRNIRSAGEHHFLLLPRAGCGRHIRDIEVLKAEDLPLLQRLDEVKTIILRRGYPEVSTSEIHCGYHRGRRPFPLFAGVFWPDIVSVHHLHLHVIIRPRLAMKLFKYPAYLRLMWKSDKQVLQEVQKKAAALQRVAAGVPATTQPSEPQTSSIWRIPNKLESKIVKRNTGFEPLP